MPQQHSNKTNMTPFRSPPVNLILRSSLTYFLQHSLKRNLRIICPLNLGPNSIERAFNRVFRRCVNHFTLYRRCIRRPSTFSSVCRMGIRVEADLVSLALVAFGEFEVINRIATVIFGKFLPSARFKTIL